MDNLREKCEILGVSDTSPTQEVRQKFQKLARKCNPDMSDERYRLILDAYKTLSNPKERAKCALGELGIRLKRMGLDDEAILSIYNHIKEIEGYGGEFEYSLAHSSRALNAAFGSGMVITSEGAITSMDMVTTMPIFAARKNNNLSVTKFWMDHVFNVYTAAVEMQEPIPVTLMYPISNPSSFSSLVSDPIAKSVCLDLEQLSQIDHFEHDYHTRRNLDNIIFQSYGSGFETALVLRYLHEVSKLPLQEILDIAYNKERFGSQTAFMDFQDCPGKYDLASLLGLKVKAESNDFCFQLDDLPEMFDHVYLHWSAPNMGISMKFKNAPLPSLTIPEKDICFWPAGEGFEKKTDMIQSVPAYIFDLREDYEERKEHLQDESVSHLYYCVDKNTMYWEIHTPNKLDAALTAFYLVKVLAPTLEDFRQTRSGLLEE